MRTRPITVTKACAWVKVTHRRLPNVVGGMWAIGVEDDFLQLVGVAIAGRPTARRWNQEGLALEVTRVAVREGVPNGCSMLYGSCSRAGKAMGADDMFTYIHGDERGTSLKAAGWVEDTAYAPKGGEWSRASRPRAAVHDAKPKRRWFTPWSKYLDASQQGTP